MSIKIKLTDLVEAEPSLKALGDVQVFPAKVSFQVSRVIKKTRDEVRLWGEQRRKIVRELFAAIDGHPAKFKPHPQAPGELWVLTELLTLEEADAYDKALNDLGEAEISIEASTIKLADFGANAPLKPNWLSQLDWLIVE